MVTEVREPFVVVNPGGRLDERRVPAEVFGALCRRALEMGRRTLVTWGPGEERLAAAVVAAAPGAVLVLPTSLDERTWLMRRAQMVACNNTGPMHLAVAVGAPKLALFYRMPVERWGHDWPPHRMVDLTPCASSEEIPPGVRRALPAPAGRVARGGRGAGRHSRTSPSAWPGFSA